MQPATPDDRETHPTPSPPKTPRVGDRVEVRSQLDNSWGRGFIVTEITNAGIKVRRRIDDVELPMFFASSAVRKEHKRNTWWV